MKDRLCKNTIYNQIQSICYKSNGIGVAFNGLINSCLLFIFVTCLMCFLGESGIGENRLPKQERKYLMITRLK